MAFDFVLASPLLAQWALQENNALELANQSVCFICYKHMQYKIMLHRTIAWSHTHPSDTSTMSSLETDTSYYGFLGLFQHTANGGK